MRELEVGPAGDARIAVEVMGWKYRKDWHGAGCYIPAEWERPDGSRSVLPGFTTDWGAAGLVVERVQRGPEGWKQTLHLIALPYGRTYAYFGIDRPGDDAWHEGNSLYAEDGTPIGWATPLAICKAALATIALPK